MHLRYDYQEIPHHRIFGRELLKHERNLTGLNLSGGVQIRELNLV